MLAAHPPTAGSHLNMVPEMSLRVDMMPEVLTRSWRGSFEDRRKTHFCALVQLCAMLFLLLFPSTTVQAQDLTDLDLEEIVIPIRVHILRSAESSHLNCECTKEEIVEWFDRANTIWRSAAIRWELESLVYEEANNPAEFDRILELGRDADPADRRSVVHSTYPLDQKLAPGWNIFFINRMAFGGGVYNPETKSVLIGKFRPGGDINPSILAHELGHSLGLRHLREQYNLMAGRQEGIEPKDKIRLNPEQITRARTIAESGDSFGGSL